MQIEKNSIENNTKLIYFSSLGDERGQLCALEGLSECIPFEIKRVYYMWNVGEQQIRGKHAHYTLKQVLICMNGSCDVVLDDGVNRKTVHLDNPLEGLLIDGFIWREMKNFTPNTVLVVLASEHYDETDYVRDYSRFLKEAHHD